MYTGITLFFNFFFYANHPLQGLKATVVYQKEVTQEIRATWVPLPFTVLYRPHGSRDIRK